jgi:hypothetical protein
VKYECPFCGYSADSKQALKQHVLNAHLQPCKLRDWLRRMLGCPIEKLG